MIKIFDANDRDFSTAGNIIIEPIKCNEIKKKSLNGWYLEVEVPIKYNDYIAKDKLCVVKTKSKLNPQAFRIGEEIERSTRRIKFKAEHVMFDARDYILLDVRPTNLNGLNALNYINQRTNDVSPFTMYSNIENTSTAYFINKNLLEAWEIIEERWGGVFDADNWNISLLSSVGHDNGETIAYGKNLQGFDNYEDWSSVCTKIYPVGYDGIMLPEKFLEANIQYDKPYTRIINFETNLDTEEQTETNLIIELRNKAQEYIEENKVPKVSYTIISNINGDLEIGDTVKVLHPFVNIFTEVLEYEYNLISKKVLSLTFGNYNRDVKTKFDNIKNTINQITEAVSKQEVLINNQTNLINSLNKNGYVYIDDNEILILDALPKESAQNVWRFGLGGIGFSSNGYEGPFEVAMTMDGQINANFITTGTLSVARIEGLANFISETNSQLSTLEVEQGNISARVTSTENSIVSLQSQIDGAIQFWNGSNIPTLSNYPASDWTTEAQRNNHRADIYTVIQDIQGELKQGKSYRFDKVGNTWQWIELTDNELSAVQALANSKAKVFYTTPTVPYNLNDLWLKDGELYRCKTAKDANGSYSASDWELAVEYTDDTVALLAQSAANAAQSTADGAVTAINNIKDTTGQAEGKIIYINDSNDDTLISAKFNGETNQATRSGRNLYNYKDTTEVNPRITVDNEGWITATYDNSSGSSTVFLNYYTNNLNLSPATDYAIFTEIKSVSGTGILQVVSNGQFASTANYYLNGVTAGSVKKNVIATKASGESIANGLRTYARFGAGESGSVTFRLSVLADTTVTTNDFEYEAFGVSPSPDYPSEIKNLEGKNIFDEILENGGFVNGGRNAETAYRIRSKNYTPVTENTKYTISASENNTGKTLQVSISYYNKNDYTTTRLSYSDWTNLNNFVTFTTPANCKYIRFLLRYLDDSTITKDDNFNKFMIEEGISATPYAPYQNLVLQFTNEDETKKQTVYFPLTEGQKLYEGSYLADDGIHNAHKHIIAEAGLSAITIDDMKANGIFYSSVGGMLNNKTITFSQELEEAADIEYELEEEEIIPYNTDQQKAWDNIMELMTYKNITHIYSDAYAEIEYVKDNGLDIYETKANANRQYEHTTEKFAQQQITNESITNTVSQTITTVANNYNELKTKFDDYAPVSDVVSLQTSVEQIQTNTYTKTEVNEKLIDGSVQKVSTTAGTFDSNGLTIEKTDAKAKGNFNEKGITVMDATSGTDEELLFAGFDETLNETIVRTQNITVEKHITLKDAVRMEKYENPVLGGHGVGLFII